MTNKKSLDSILSDLPDTLKAIQEEVKTVGKTVLDKQLQKTNLVTREEFEEQKLILQEILNKVALLEEKIDKLS